MSRFGARPWKGRSSARHMSAFTLALASSGDLTPGPAAGGIDAALERMDGRFGGHLFVASDLRPIDRTNQVRLNLGACLCWIAQEVGEDETWNRTALGGCWRFL